MPFESHDIERPMNVCPWKSNESPLLPSHEIPTDIHRSLNAVPHTFFRGRRMKP